MRPNQTLLSFVGADRCGADRCADGYKCADMRCADMRRCADRCEAVRLGSRPRARLVVVIVLLVLLLLQWELAGLDFFDMVMALPGISLVRHRFYVPAVFRQEYGFDVPPSVEDGIRRLEAISLFPFSERFAKRKTATLAFAMPIVGSQFEGIVSCIT